MLTTESRQSEFPHLEGRIYLNTAAEGIPPLRVEKALQHYFRDRCLGMEGRGGHFEQWLETRRLLAKFMGLSTGEVGICSSSSEAFNLAALALNLKPGDEVIVSDLEYPSGASPWLNPQWGVKLRCWRSVEGSLKLEDLAPLLTSRTRMVVCSLVSFWNGFRITVPEVARVVQENSTALLAVDITQGIGRIPLDLEGADLIVSSAHKWLISSHGCGIVGVRAKRAGELSPPAGGWFNQENPYSSERFEKIIQRQGAMGYMTGMPNFPSIYALRTCLEYLDSIGVDQIDGALQDSVLACRQGLSELGVHLISPENPKELGGILAFRHPDAERIHAELKRQNIFVMRTLDRIRISLHGYNRLSDVEVMLGALRKIL